MSSERFTTNEAAERLGVTPARVRQMVARGEIESEKHGRDRFVTADAITEAMKRKTKPGPTPNNKPSAANKRAGGRIRASNEASTGKKGKGKK
jgi:excisionase family DNA binding protein